MQSSIQWPTNAEIGYGINSAAFSAMGVPFKGSTVPSNMELMQSNSSPGGMSSSLSMELIEDTSTLARSLDLTISGAMKAGAANVEGSARFVYNNISNSNSVYLLVRYSALAASRQMSAEAITKLEFNEDVLKKLKDDPLEFLRSYGDSFVSGYRNGGEIAVLFAMQTRSETEKIELSVKAKGTAQSYSAAADLQGKLNSLTENREVSMDVYQQGGPPLDWSDLTVENIFSNITAFDKAIRDNRHQTRYRAQLTPYRSIQDLAPVDFGKIDDIQRELEAYSLVKLRVMERLNFVDYVDAHKTQFLPNFSDKSIRELKTELERSVVWISNQEYELEETKASDYKRRPLTETEIEGNEGLEVLKKIESMFPKRYNRLPETAGDVLEMAHDAGVQITDGFFDIYMVSGSEKVPVRLFLTFGSGPKAYLDLGLDGDPNANVSVWPKSPAGEWRQGDTLTTKYRRVRLDPKTKLVTPDDTTFAETNGKTLHDHSAHGKEVATYHHADFGVASASNHPKGSGSYGTATIDITNTTFCLDPDYPWKLRGFWAAHDKTVQLPSKENGYRKCRVTANGATGMYYPEHGIKLKFLAEMDN